MSGVVLRCAPNAQLVQLTHSVPAQSIEIGALLLRSAVEYFPVGSVHLAVVDPGVGSERDGIVVVTDNGTFVGPNNGILYPSAEILGLREVRRIENDRLLLQPLSSTFHGRDVFAPIAGRLAAGQSPDAVGPEMSEMVKLEGIDAVESGERIEGKVLHVDHFGNLISNIAMEKLPGSNVSISVGTQLVHGLARTYSDVAVGQILALGGSWRTLEIAENGGNAALTLGVQRGATITVTRKGTIRD